MIFVSSLLSLRSPYTFPNFAARQALVIFLSHFGNKMKIETEERLHKGNKFLVKKVIIHFLKTILEIPEIQRQIFKGDFYFFS